MGGRTKPSILPKNAPVERAVFVKRFSILIITAFVLAGMPVAHSAEYYSSFFQYSVRSAPKWSSLFLQTNGWTGADGIFSISANGIDTQGARQATDTIFWFSDTYIGQMEYECRHFKRTGDITVLRNSGAILQGVEPDRSAISFFVGYDNGELDAMIVPDTSQAEAGSWYWLGDGFLSAGHLHIFAYRFLPNPFRYDGVVIIRLPQDTELPIEHQDFEQYETPLFNAANANGHPVVFGAGVFANTQDAGVPAPDGYIYVYGVEDNPQNRRLLVARVPEEQFSQPAAWRFWDGSGWTTDMNLASPVADHVSNEMSVSPIRLNDGTAIYVMIYQHNGTSPYICARIGRLPYAAFGPAEPIYKCPERENNPTGKVFTYNAKGHPHLSDPGTLLISYNVNTFNDTGEFIEYGEIYHPRFIELTYTLRDQIVDDPPVDLGDIETSNPLREAVVGLDDWNRRVWRVAHSYYGDEDNYPLVEDPTCVEPEDVAAQSTNLVEPDDSSPPVGDGDSTCFLRSLLYPT
jgi:hypothetical protein